MVPSWRLNDKKIAKNYNYEISFQKKLAKESGDS